MNELLSSNDENDEYTQLMEMELLTLIREIGSNMIRNIHLDEKIQELMKKLNTKKENYENKSCLHNIMAYTYEEINRSILTVYPLISLLLLKVKKSETRNLGHHFQQYLLKFFYLVFYEKKN